MICATRLASVTWVLTEAALLLKSVSGCLAETVALLVRDPVVAGVTVMATVAFAPLPDASQIAGYRSCRCSFRNLELLKRNSRLREAYRQKSRRWHCQDRG